jgi:hypothetical protein
VKISLEPAAVDNIEKFLVSYGSKLLELNKKYPELEYGDRMREFNKHRKKGIKKMLALIIEYGG